MSELGLFFWSLCVYGALGYETDQMNWGGIVVMLSLVRNWYLHSDFAPDVS